MSVMHETAFKVIKDCVIEFSEGGVTLVSCREKLVGDGIKMLLVLEKGDVWFGRYSAYKDYFYVHKNSVAEIEMKPSQFYKYFDEIDGYWG